jgi:uncharacterized protein DUF1574
MTYRPDPKRGRTTLVLMGALIFAAEIAAGILIDYAPLKIRFPLLAKVLDSARKLESSRKILFLGSSRFGNAVSAEAVTQVLHEENVADGITVFNAQIGASDPVVMEFETDKLLAAGIRPSMAVIEILPEVLARRNLWMNYHLGRQFRWSEVWNSLPDSYRAGTLSVVIATRFNAIYTFRSEFQQWAMDGLKLRFESSNFADANSRKRRRVNLTESADVEVLLRGAAFGRKNVRGYEIGGLNTRALIRMIERYSKLGTTIVLIAPPVSSPYRTAYGSPVDAAYLAYMQQLGKTYGTYFFDFRHRLADRYFFTPYYTTVDGKLHFSRLLAREVIVPLIAAGNEGIRSRNVSPSDIPSKPAIGTRTPPDDGPRRGG